MPEVTGHMSLHWCILVSTQTCSVYIVTVLSCVCAHVPDNWCGWLDLFSTGTLHYLPLFFLPAIKMVKHYRGQKYSKLHDTAVRTGQLFTDPLFPPAGESLGHTTNQEIVWKRPSVRWDLVYHIHTVWP